MSFSTARSPCTRPDASPISRSPGIGRIIRCCSGSTASTAATVNFLGVILERIAFDTFHGKEVIAQNTAQLATQLGADAALVSWIGSGNAFVDVMLTLRACEGRGIKTTLVTYEYGGKDGVDSPLLFYTPAASAMTSTGSRDRWIELPAAEKIVGPYEEIKVLTYPGAPLTSARGPVYARRPRHDSRRRRLLGPRRLELRGLLMQRSRR